MLKIMCRVLEALAVVFQTQNPNEWLAPPLAFRSEVIMRVCTLIACLLSVPEAAIAEEFSWKSLLGKSSENIRAELGKFASCEAQYNIFNNANNMSSYTKPLSFYIRYPVPPSAKITIAHWHDPVGGYTSFSSEDTLQSSLVRELNCSAEMNVNINALIFENIVFDISIKYDRCDRRDTSCNQLVQSQIDRAFEQKLPKDIIYAPFGSYGATAPNKDMYYKIYSSMETDSYLQSMLLDAGSCGSFPDKYRCIIVSATADDGVWHSITMTEAFESNFFSDRILGRFASSQRFTLIDVDKRARAAFTSEIRGVIEDRDRLDHEKNRNIELRVSPLKSDR